jgi:diguanylate cyclase (GGDEF)-like protein
MKTFFGKLSMVPKGLRYKLMLAFSLMTVIPLLVTVYLATTYIFPIVTSLYQVSSVLVITICIALLGMFLSKRLIEPVIDMSLEARIIAGGGYRREVKVEHEDEIGELGNVINGMTKKIRANLEELSAYGERTKQINLEIHNKVVALSSLLHIGDAITMAKLPLENILGIIAEKVAHTYETGYAIFFSWENEDEKSMVVRSSYNLPTELLEDAKVKHSSAFLGKLLMEPRIWAIDKTTKLPSEAKTFLNEYGLKNLIVLPVLSRKKLIGLLIVGNQEDAFAYKNDDIELYKVFTRQIAIAVENDYLMQKTRELSVVDELTGLYNKRYIMTRLEEEIKRSAFYQRPCSFIVFDVDNFTNLRNVFNSIAIEKALRKIAQIMKGNISEVGKAARLGPDIFALLLPEVNKKRATELAEDIRRIIEEEFAKKTAQEDIEHLTVSVGVSENPIDGATADELMEKASKAVKVAKSLGRNRVVAHIGG